MVTLTVNHQTLYVVLSPLCCTLNGLFFLFWRNFSYYSALTFMPNIYCNAPNVLYHLLPLHSCTSQRLDEIFPGQSTKGDLTTSFAFVSYHPSFPIPIRSILLHVSAREKTHTLFYTHTHTHTYIHSLTNCSTTNLMPGKGKA